MKEKIRRMKKSDLSKCAKLLEHAYSENPYNEKFIFGNSLKYIKNKYDVGKNFSFVFILDEKIIGFAIASLSYWAEGPQAIFEEIVFDKKNRGQGYAKKMYDYLEKKLKQKKVSSLMLWVKKNSAAHKFHLKNNYKEANDLVMMFKEL